MTDETTQKRKAALAKLRAAYRAGNLTDAQIKRAESLGIELDTCILEPGVNDLATVSPKIAAQWHPTKNGNLKPADVMAGSGKQAWWRHRMPDGSWHEWQAQVCSRVKGSYGCPYCSGVKALQGFNDLATVNPEIAAQWHPTENGNLKPTEVTATSGKRVWWLGKCGHAWKATVASRMTGCGCPYCNKGELLQGFNDLATANPELAVEWHPTKNGDLKPADVVAGSGKKVWWLCPKCGREWQAVIGSRSKGHGCTCARGRAVVCVETGEMFRTAALATKWAGAKSKSSSIANCCKGKLKSAYGYHWRYADSTDKLASSSKAKADSLQAKQCANA